ncbi:MAG: DUF2520 domain-containing protein [Coriobacteriales bacterium]|nr:DUF2520 domain-containing protein [Coriobacteriales bacterium]
MGGMAENTVFDKTVSIIGAGRVGQAVGTILRQAGVSVAAVTARKLQTAQAAALVSGGRPGVDNAEAARAAEFVYITVPDDAVARVVEEMARDLAFRPGQVVAHASGALGLGVLAPAAKAGASIGCAHPMQSFASARHAVKEIPGSVFGVTADSGATEVIYAFVHVLGGTPVTVSEEQRPLYHAAASMASNMLVALEDMSAGLLEQAGFSPDEAQAALYPLIRGTAQNIRQFGTRGSLTGPIARGDVDTVRMHIKALEVAPASARGAYRVLGLRALETALAQGQVDPETAETIEQVLKEAPSR